MELAHLKPRAVHELLLNSGAIDGDEPLMMDLANGFEKLDQAFEAGPFTNDSPALEAYFEVALLLARRNIRGTSARAQGALMELRSTYPDKVWRVEVKPSSEETP